MIKRDFRYSIGDGFERIETADTREEACEKALEMANRLKITITVTDVQSNERESWDVRPSVQR